MNVFQEFALTCVVALVGSAIILVLKPLDRQVRAFLVSGPSVSRRAADRMFLLLFLGYVVTFGSLSFLRHLSFHSGGHDLGVFDQVVWNSLRGRLFENSIFVEHPAFLGAHFSPILLALVPLYALWSDPIVLLAVQTLALAIAAFPVYWYAREQIGSTHALVISAGYFLFPSVQYVNLFEFHEISLATPLLAFGLYFLLHRRHVPFVICLCMALLTKEEVGFITMGFGVFLLIRNQKRGLGLGLIVLGAAWVMLTLLYLIPSFRVRDYGADYYFVERYSYLGNSVPDIVFTAITNPILVFEHLLVPNKIEFILHLLVPLAFVPLVGLEVFLLALPTLGYLLIGDYAFQYSIRFQYTAPLLPFVFFATVVGLRRLSVARLLRIWTFNPNSTRLSLSGLVTVIGLASLINYFFQSPGPLALRFDAAQYHITSHTLLGYYLMRQIPPDAGVMTETNFAPHLAQRMHLYIASVPPDIRDVEYLLVDKTLSIHTDYEMIWRDLLTSPYYETLFERDGYILKKRAPISLHHPLNIKYGDQITLLGFSIEPRGDVRRGDELQIVLAWRAEVDIRERYLMFVHLLDSQGRIWAQEDREPGGGWFRTDRWQAGSLTPDRFVLNLSQYMPPGEYHIVTGLYSIANGHRLGSHDQHRNWIGTGPKIGTVRVEKKPVVMMPDQLEIAKPMAEDLGELRLLGYTPALGTVNAGTDVHLGFYWSATRRPKEDWVVGIS